MAAEFTESASDRRADEGREVRGGPSVKFPTLAAAALIDAALAGGKQEVSDPETHDHGVKVALSDLLRPIPDKVSNIAAMIMAAALLALRGVTR